jgi:hypothetical protein
MGRGSYLHWPPFFRLSIVCMQFDAHMQPGVAHFFEQAFMQAFTSQLTGAADAKVLRPKMKTEDSKASDKRCDMANSCKIDGSKTE